MGMSASGVRAYYEGLLERVSYKPGVVFKIVPAGPATDWLRLQIECSGFDENLSTELDPERVLNQHEFFTEVGELVYILASREADKWFRIDGSKLLDPFAAERGKQGEKLT